MSKVSNFMKNTLAARAKADFATKDDLIRAIRRDQVAAGQSLCGSRFRSESSSAQLDSFMRRLYADLQPFINGEAAVEGVYLWPAENSVYTWSGVISGPDATPWEGGMFPLTVTLHPEYPLKPPRVRFDGQPPFHPNVAQIEHAPGEGFDVCASHLADDWSPVYTLFSMLMAVRSVIAEPNWMSCLNPSFFPQNARNVHPERARQLTAERSAAAAYEVPVAADYLNDHLLLRFLRLDGKLSVPARAVLALPPAPVDDAVEPQGVAAAAETGVGGTAGGADSAAADAALDAAVDTEGWGGCSDAP